MEAKGDKNSLHPWRKRAVGRHTPKERQSETREDKGLGTQPPIAAKGEVVEAKHHLQQGGHI